METRKQKRETLQARSRQILQRMQSSVEEGIRVAGDAGAAGGTYNSGSTVRKFVEIVLESATKARDELADAYAASGGYG